MNNNDKIKEILESEPVPQELEPDSIKEMLDRNAQKNKRSKISVAGRVAAAAAAVTVIAGGSVNYLSRKTPDSNKPSASVSEPTTTSTTKIEPIAEKVDQHSYMSGAADYAEVYSIFEKSAKKTRKNSQLLPKTNGIVKSADFVEEAIEEEAAYDDAAEYEADTEPEQYMFSDEEVSDTFTETDTPHTSDSQPDENNYENPDYSDTYNQEENVLEADIVKTDGKNIYYLFNSNDTFNEKGEIDAPLLRIAETDNGKFKDTTTIDISSILDYSPSSVSVNDMYVYNDMIAIIGVCSNYSLTLYEESDFSSYSTTFAAFLTKDIDPEVISVYYQEGEYNDVRIAPDGFMYLITDYAGCSITEIESAENYECYIPKCGLDDECDYIPPEDILLPSDCIDNAYYFGYSIIGSIDLNNSGEPLQYDTKALAEYGGTLYSSANNIYAATASGSNTNITRIAIDNGNITPAASAEIEGYVNDQFSMSEYNDLFRIAVSCSTASTEYSGHWWNKVVGDDYKYTTYSNYRDNRIYVLDMDLNTVGEVADFGVDETIKSVSFQGDMAYVVTFRQTDPLFAIDLSNPAEPIILDEYKINGYSSYMQKWDDGLLLGFGVDAADNGIMEGLKAVMFDNSDPNNLQEVGIFKISMENSDYVTSEALSDRKGLFIAPEKNLFGFQYSCYSWSENNGTNNTQNFILLSYENGEFVEKYKYEIEDNEYSLGLIPERAVYIGNYVYIISGSQFTAVDMTTFEETDITTFENDSDEKDDEVKDDELTIDDINEKLGIELSLPDCIGNVKATVFDGTPTIYSLDMNRSDGHRYILRMAKADVYEDISGIDSEWTSTNNTPLSDIAYELKLNENSGEGLAQWMSNGIICSIYMPKDADELLLDDMFNAVNGSLLK